MDNLTHTLFAMTLARTPLARAGRGATAALVLASNAPDIDIVAAAHGSVSYLEWHRGPTHGPLGIVGLGLVTAGLVWIGRRGMDRSSPPEISRASATFPILAAISTIGVMAHVVMDLPTSYGTRLLSPFDWRWFALDWLPIIDVYLLATLAAGLALSQWSKASRRPLAAIVLMLMAANYGLRAAAHRQALTLASTLSGSQLPQPCDRTARAPRIDYWPRPSGATSPPGGPCLVEMAAVPTMRSPFRWSVIARLSNGYELYDIDVLDARWRRPAQASDRVWRRAVRFPDQWRPATITAAATRTGRVFLGFSRFPAARTLVDPTGMATVRWIDMRFAAGTLLADTWRPRNLFTVLVRIGADGAVEQEQLGQ